ncbi:hypothetical protein F5B21DRAFT_460160 [Xylaria acuta]|nr:hypothetical protein F5B21DRAFT_460160 [Xylaria acuta]
MMLSFGRRHWLPSSTLCVPSIHKETVVIQPRIMSSIGSRPILARAVGVCWSSHGNISIVLSPGFRRAPATILFLVLLSIESPRPLPGTISLVLGQVGTEISVKQTDYELCVHVSGKQNTDGRDCHQLVTRICETSSLTILQQTRPVPHPAIILLPIMRAQ